MTTFVIADCHFGHRGMVTFLREDGTKQRPYDTVADMNEDMIEKWNSVVSPKDTVLVLGDFVINRSALPIADRLNGTKELIMGNHDTMRAEEYLKYFKKLHGSKGYNDYVLTHIPLHPNSVCERYKGNIHGHLHHHSVPDGEGLYYCVSAERVGYMPINIDEVINTLK